MSFDSFTSMFSVNISSLDSIAHCLPLRIPSLYWFQHCSFIGIHFSPAQNTTIFSSRLPQALLVNPYRIHKATAAFTISHVFFRSFFFFFTFSHNHKSGYRNQIHNRKGGYHNHIHKSGYRNHILNHNIIYHFFYCQVDLCHLRHHIWSYYTSKFCSIGFSRLINAQRLTGPSATKMFLWLFKPTTHTASRVCSCYCMITYIIYQSINTFQMLHFILCALPLF